VVQQAGIEHGAVSGHGAVIDDGLARDALHSYAQGSQLIDSRGEGRLTAHGSRLSQRARATRRQHGWTCVPITVPIDPI
jgi:hypothetical protein